MGAGWGFMGMGDAPCKGGARHDSAADVRVARAALPVVLAMSVVAGAALAAAAGPPWSGRTGRAALAPGLRLPPPTTENPSWSGEVAWASKNGVTGFDRVTGAWVQPGIVASSSPEYADTWVGVDGYDGKLLQTGTTAWTKDGAVSYEAWFVAWTGTPSGMTVIDEPVAAGDRMQAAIDRNRSGTWSVQLDDTTAGWSWTTTVTYPASGSTAEWIEEAPGTWSTGSHYQTLADYGSATFTTVRADGAAPATVTTFDIAEDGAVVSYPSTYDTSQDSFTVRYGRPAPTVRWISPTSGPASGGSIVELSGADLGSSPVVRFGSVEATVLRSSTRTLVVRVPAHAPGEVPVTVTVASAADAATAALGFEYRSVHGYGSATHAAASQVRRATVVGFARDARTGGFWEATSDGGVYDVDAPDLGTLTALVDRLSIGPVSGIAATPTGGGYWLVTSKGAVYEFGSARSFGTLGHRHLGSRIVGMSAAPTGQGYWLVAADGKVFAFGAARFCGSLRASARTPPPVGIVAG